MSRDTEPTRRRVLAGAAGAALVGIAGCSEATSRSFEAAPVGLQADDRDTLGLDTAFADSTTTTRELAGAEVTITSHVAGFKRVVE